MSKTLLRDQESCVINGGTKYFSFGTGARQGDQISTLYLF